MTVIKINAIALPKDRAPELEKRFAARRGAMDGVPGFLGFELLRPVANAESYFVVTRWETDQAFQDWRSGGMRDQAHSEGGDRKPMSMEAELLEFEVVDLAAIAAAS